MNCCESYSFDKLADITVKEFVLSDGGLDWGREKGQGILYVMLIDI